GMNATQARRAFETMAGSVHASASQVAQALGRNFSQMLQARGGEEPAAEQVVTSAGFSATVHGARERAGVDARARKGLGLAQGDSPAAQGLWAQAIGGGGRSEGDGNGGDLRYSAGGLIAGFDHALDNDTMLGAALGRTRSHWSSSGTTGALGSGAVTSYQAGAYARFNTGAWKFVADGTYGLHRFTTHRTVDLGAGVQTASSGHRAREWALGLQAEYAPDALKPGQWQLRPVGGLRHARFTEDAFDESGAGAANLTVSQRRNRSTTVQAGAKWLHAFSDGKGEVQLQAMFSHLWGDNDAPVTARMAGQAATFTASGTPLPRDALTLGAAISRQVSPTLGFYANAALEYRGSGHNAYSLVAGLRKKW
ncbi:MAG: autotransporter outer membrane beta-barrel domain-containing protein, partial [Burkholderiaceae bacterium]